ncbi:MAG: type I-U CRISPR-associated protein Csb2 [Methylobacter sp.]|nr:type I-U CRISPR-associated protein Csb2 [Methylobacter sp.]
MSRRALLVSVRLLDGRYHGSGVWPPSPFRLFQALVAAVHTGRDAPSDEINALCWLENLAPPIIATPKARQSVTTTYFVPRNGADAAGGDLAKAAKNRDAKLYRPWLFDENVPFVYIWTFDADDTHALAVVSITELLYQLGRGIDMAFATAESIDAEEAERKILEHPGSVYRPSPNGSSNTLPCPRKNNSLNSLIKRHIAQLSRLKGEEFRKVPPPLFDMLGYDCPSAKLLYDIAENTSAGAYVVQPLTEAAKFAEKVRDFVARRFSCLESYPLADYVDRIILGRNAAEEDKALRIRIIPLPSIGFTHTPQGIRRLLVEVPPDCPIPLDDIAWAFSGLNLGVDLDAGEVIDEMGPILVSADDRKMLVHYGIETDKMVRVWRTVTPVALPISRQRGKTCGDDRAINENQIAYAARQALRHAGLDAKAEICHIQREPFDAKGACADEFAHGKRFPATRLYHLEVTFNEPISGPILIGDGRYLGLGLMHPIQELTEDVFLLQISSNNRPPIKDRMAFLNAVRRALMACARDLEGFPSRLFSGHEFDGAPARSGQHEHVFLAAEDSDDDGLLDKLLIVAPWRVDRHHCSRQETRTAFEQVSLKLEIVRAGRLGIFQFAKPEQVLTDDRLLQTSSSWRSTTSYEPTRYPKTIDEAPEKIEADIVIECLRRGLPKPNVEIISVQAGRRGGFRADARLLFSVAVSGPLMLGRESHKGGGLFYAEN